MNNANDLAAAVLANNNDTKSKTATTTTANKSITHNNSNTNKNNVVSTNLRAVKESSSLCNNNSSVASSNLNALEQQHQQQPKTAIESVKTSMKNVGEKQLSNESIKHHQISDQEETMNHHYTAHHNLNHHHNHYQKQPPQQQSSSSSSSALNGFSGHTNSLNDLKSKFESINTNSSTTTTANCSSSSQSLRTSSHHYTNSSGGGSNHHNNPYFSAWANIGSANNNNNNIRQSANLNSAKLLSPFSSSTSGIRENIFFNHTSDHKTPNTNVAASNEVSSISSSPTTIKSPSQLIAAATANNSSSGNNKAKIMTSSDASNENTTTNTTPLTNNSAQSQQRTNRISNVPCNHHHVTNDENEVTAVAQVNNNSSEQTSNATQPIVNSSSTSCSINGSFSALTLVGGSTKSNGVATTTVKPTSECSGGNTHVSLRQHSAKCNIMLRKMRRGNKRSKSLPSKFNIDSVLEYLNYSMILNKYELRKQLNQQRNLIFTHHNYNNYNTRLSSSNASTCSTSQQPQQQHLDTANKNKQSCVVGLRKSTYQHQLSSGYNSENHSSSSNSQTTATTTATTTPTTTACRSNAASCHNNDEYMALFNFYRLTLNHLPSNFSANTLCTCSVAATGNNRKSASLKAPCDNECNPVSSSPIISSTAAAASRGGGTTDDDELLVDEDEDFDDEEDDEMLLEDEMMGEEEDEPVAAATTSNNVTNTSCKSPTTTSQQHQHTKTPSKTSNVDPTVLVVTEATPEAAECSNVHTSGPSRFHRAPGTSMCPHTAKIDIRRVRSYQDLTQAQILYTLSDFVFKEKLGEGFFANVKKIVSKRTNKEMVLKELKLGCVGDEISAGVCGAETESATSPTTNDPVESSAASSSTHTSTSFNSNRISAKTFNYAELHAAHKSFLKEAQVLRNLNHPNIIKLLGILFTKQKHLNLVLEYIGGGTLKDIIHNISIGLPWKLRVGYARDIAAAMQYLHSLNIIHRDLKSDNCLVRENGRSVVVADFGLSRIINQSSASTTSTAAKKTNNNKQSPLFTGDESLLKVANNNHSLQLLSANLSGLTPVQSGTNSFIVAAKRKLKRRGENHPRKQRYAVVGNSFSMAPEMLKHELYDERVDIFSFGIICCEIIGRVQADPDYLPRTSDFGLNVELFRKKYCEADCPKHFIKIAIACCELEPEKRPPFAKTHVWLETILGHLETNNPIPKNLLKNILESNTKRPSVVVSSSNLITQ